MHTYVIHYAPNVTARTYDRDDPAWEAAETASITNFRPESSSHRPETRVKLLYTHKKIVGIFIVSDCFVRCVHTEYRSPVYKDSCVEFFIKPKPSAGYFNFEFNCGGAFLSSYIVDATRTSDGFKQWTPFPPEHGAMVSIRHSLPPIVEPEIALPVTWTLVFSIPFALLEKYVGPLGNVRGQNWTGNFYKCADQCSHPHWASWSPVEALNFHAPQCFGEIVFQ